MEVKTNLVPTNPVKEGENLMDGIIMIGEPSYKFFESDLSF